MLGQRNEGRRSWAGENKFGSVAVPEFRWWFAEKATSSVVPRSWDLRAIFRRSIRVIGGSAKIER